MSEELIPPGTASGGDEASPGNAGGSDKLPEQGGIQATGTKPRKMLRRSRVKLLG